MTKYYFTFSNDERRKGTLKMNETSGLWTSSFLDHHCPDGHWVWGKEGALEHMASHLRRI